MSCKSVIKGCAKSALKECLASVPKACESICCNWVRGCFLFQENWLQQTKKNDLSRTTYPPFVAPQNHSQHVTPYQFQRGGEDPFCLIYQFDPLAKSIPNRSCKQKLQLSQQNVSCFSNGPRTSTPVPPNFLPPQIQGLHNICRTARNTYGNNQQRQINAFSVWSQNNNIRAWPR